MRLVEIAINSFGYCVDAGAGLKCYADDKKSGQTHMISYIRS